MFYTNLLNLKNITYKNINYDSFVKGVNTIQDESVMSNGYAKLSYNFDYSDGALKDGLGISVPKVKYSNISPEYTKLLDIPNELSVRGVWLFQNWHETANVLTPFIVIYCHNSKFYYNDFHTSKTEWVEMEGLYSYKKPLVTSYNLNGVDTLLVFSESDGLYTWTELGGAKKIEDAPCINSMCIHNERLFVTSKENERRVWFSDDLNPTNFNVNINEGGFVDLVDDFGRSNKVISFEGYLYVFRDYNIARITAYAEQEEFFVNQLYVGSGRILKDTVAICGNKIMYLATDGLYAFNGSSSSKINLGINNVFDDNNENAVGGFCNGCYYLACRLNYDDDAENESIGDTDNNSLIRFDVNTGKLTILRGCDIRDVSIINDTKSSFVLVVLRQGVEYKLGMVDGSGAIFDVPTNKVWFTPNSDFNYPDRYKLVKEVYLETDSDCIVRVVADGKKKDYKVKGSKEIAVIKPRMKGIKISVSFISNTVNTRITNVQVRVGIL
ncbi:MAG: hypothetical protein E7354_00915 [Clostridiales bacterium]|nr:hypothetical protein [Clostridiales bacterium]